MRWNRSKSPLQPPDGTPPDIPADRWQIPTPGRRKSSVLLPVAIVVIGGAIVALAAYATAVLFNLYPDRLIAGLLHKAPASTTAGPAALPQPTAQSPAIGSNPPPSRASDAPPRPASRFSRPFALWRTLTYSLTDTTPDQPQPFQTMRQMTGDIQYVDGGTFQTPEAVVKLSGIASLPREAVCLGADKAKFACGLMARASLSLLFSPERPRCYPDVSLATSEPAWLCTARGRLLSAAQVEAGFALPSQPSIEAYVELAAKARTARAGAWNGDWTLAATVTTGP